jgi:predicted nucleotidyltransferase
LHDALRASAREAGLSLNEYCARKLAQPPSSLAGEGVEAVRRATALFGSAILGVIVFGSWARGQEAKTSDIDLLVVLDDSMEIGRRLYRTWDESPVDWDGHGVEPHFVHLPLHGARISGMWAEVATDGVILHEREFLVSKRLVEIRQKIATGQLVRRRVHGQSYWIETKSEHERETI